MQSPSPSEKIMDSHAKANGNKRAQPPELRGDEKKEEENGECSLRQLELEKTEKPVEDSLSLTQHNTPASKKKEEEKLCEKRRILKEEWDRWVSEWKQLHEEEKWQRQLLRDGEASDDENVFGEEQVVACCVEESFRLTREEREQRLEMIIKERHVLRPTCG